MVHWRRKWQPIPVFLPGEPMNSMKKQKKRDEGQNMSSLGRKVSSMLLVKRRGQSLIAPERMKWLSQSRNDAQMWMCLVVKVKPDSIKNNIA